MSEPWMQPSDLYKSGMNNTYLRMMNTSGIPFRDHTGSMVPPLLLVLVPNRHIRTHPVMLTRLAQDLCSAALRFASDTLRPGGHFVCKYYQGSQDKAFEKRLKKLFAKVHREKPDSSRKVSEQAFDNLLPRSSCDNTKYPILDRNLKKHIL
jgi:21S rRNA (uridine2791-2'-O)-methyltransferase